MLVGGGGVGGVTDLPHSNDGISDEDKKDDKGFHEGGDGLLTFLEPGEHLRSKWERVHQCSDSSSHCISTPVYSMDI